MAKSVFRPNEITSVDDKILLKLSHFYEEEAPEEEIEEEPVYEGPTVEDLRAEAEEFKRQWEAERQKMMDDAKEEAENIIKVAQKAAFDEVKRQTNVAQEEKTKTIAEAEKIRNEAKTEADALLAEATSTKERITKEAYEQGYEQGHTDGFKEGNGEVQRLIDRLHLMVEKIMDKRVEILAETEQQIVDLVLLMTRKVVKVISENQRNVVMSNIVHALRKVKGRGDVHIHVNMAELALTTEHTKDFLSAVENVRNITIVEDSAVDKGGCIIETDFGSIDARIASQLAELEQKILEISPVKTNLKPAIKTDK